MPTSAFPPPKVAESGAAEVVTKGQVGTGLRGDGVSPGPTGVDLDTPDPIGANTRSFVKVAVTYANASHGGAIFSALVNGSNGDRFRFQTHPIGLGGAGWVDCAAMDMRSGHWDYAHRTYDSVSYSAWLVPCPGAGEVRMVREAGAAGAGICMAAAYASHNAFPSPPKHVGKRDVLLMIRGLIVPAVATLINFEHLAASSADPTVRTLTGASTNRFTNGGKRLWIQGYDLAYLVSGATDRVKVNLVARTNGAVSTNEANSPPVFEVGLLSAPGRSISLPQPLELQNALGSSQGSVGIKAISSAGGVNMLQGTVYCFETL